MLKKVTVGKHKSALPFLTSRLNQDVLEIFFSYVRRMGHSNDHPSPLEFKYRLRWFVLGKKSDAVFTEKLNTEEHGEPNLLTPLEDTSGQDTCLTRDMCHNLAPNLESG